MFAFFAQAFVFLDANDSLADANIFGKIDTAQAFVFLDANDLLTGKIDTGKYGFISFC